MRDSVRQGLQRQPDFSDLRIFSDIFITLVGVIGMGLGEEVSIEGLLTKKKKSGFLSKFLGLTFTISPHSHSKMDQIKISCDILQGKEEEN